MMIYLELNEDKCFLTRLYPKMFVVCSGSRFRGGIQWDAKIINDFTFITLFLETKVISD